MVYPCWGFEYFTGKQDREVVGMMGKKVLVYNFGVVFFVIILLLLFTKGDSMFLSGKRPENLGAQGGKLAPCPTSPNCVSSMEKGSSFTSPLLFEGGGEVAWEALIGAIKGMKSTQIITEEEAYLHAEFSSGFFGFVDDVEFLLDNEKKVIHVRSASRLGYSDLGVNRKRVEEIRTRLNNLFQT